VEPKPGKKKKKNDKSVKQGDYLEIWTNSKGKVKGERVSGGMYFICIYKNRIMIPKEV
jgi:hypothetical protein